MPNFIVHKATGWLPNGRRITCEDWPSQELAIEALRRAKLRMGSLGNMSETEAEEYADRLAARLKIDPARPFGCSVIVEE